MKTLATTIALMLLTLLSACGPAGEPAHESTRGKTYYEITLQPGDPPFNLPCGRFTTAAERMNESLEAIQDEQPEPYEWGRRCALMQDARHALARSMHRKEAACSALEDTVVHFMLTCNNSNYADYTQYAYCKLKEFDKGPGSWECSLENRKVAKFKAYMAEQRRQEGKPPAPEYPDGTY